MFIDIRSLWIIRWIPLLRAKKILASAAPGRPPSER